MKSILRSGFPAFSFRVDSVIGAILPLSHFLFLSSLKFEMEEEKRGEMEEITSNFKAMKKKKTLSTKKVNKV